MSLFIVAAFLLVVALLSLSLQRVYFFTPALEVKRQADAGDATAKKLYRVIAFGESLELLLWAMTGAAAAGSIVLFSRLAPFLFGFALVMLSLWFAFAWLPSGKLSSLSLR